MAPNAQIVDDEEQRVNRCQSYWDRCGDDDRNAKLPIYIVINNRTTHAKGRGTSNDSVSNKYISRTFMYIHIHDHVHDLHTQHKKMC